MKNLLITILFAFGLSAVAQTNQPTFIKGTIDIRFNTKSKLDANGQPLKGVTDVYNMNVNVCDSALFMGKIMHAPLLIQSGMFSSTTNQNRSLTYDMTCDVVNPADPSQHKNVGRIFGQVPIDPSGVYKYDAGSLTCSVLSMGTAPGFDSKFRGSTLGKPVGKKPTTGLENIQKLINGKAVSVAVKRYDKMEFQQHVLCAGPVQIYQEVIVNGEMVYDYDRFAWYFKNIQVQYPVKGVVKIDRITGDIRWVEATDRKTTGKGQYVFDIRVNEPPPSEASAFAGPADESAFFTTDTSIPSLTGTMDYGDSLSSDGATLASAVKINLTGNQLTKQQAMVLCKLIVFSAVVPMNSD